MLNMRKKEKKFSLGSSVPHTVVKFNHVSRSHHVQRACLFF